MKKHFIFLIIFTLLLAIFTVCVNAEVLTDTVEPDKVVEPTLVITTDSVNDSVLYNVQYDAITDQVCAVITVDALGVCIYDDPETSYIDGIRLNGETVNSLKIPIDITKENKIVVRTVYKEDFTGTLAQISDGTYDYVNLLKNPVGLLMAGYYILAAVAVIVSIVSAMRGKNKKVKTSEEIASSVDTHAKTACSEMKVEAINTVSPLFNKLAQSQEAILKSLILTHSKDPNSHLEALECLRTVSTPDIGNILTKVQDEIKTNINSEKEHKAHVLESLTKIAETTQEESADGEIPIF